MKVLIPILSFGVAGGYRVLSKFADELLVLGHTVEFLCPEGSDKPYFPTNAPIYWINKHGDLYQDEDHKAIKKDNFFSIQTKLTRALRKIPVASYDVIIANQSLTVLPVILCKLQYKTLYYIQAYEPEFYMRMGGFKKTLLRILSTLSYKTNIYTVVNAAVYMNYKEIKTDKVLHPGVDFELFFPKEKSLDVNPNIVIGTVGRLEKFKGTTYVLDAFKMIKQKFPSAELHIAFGNPADYDGIEGIRCLQPKGDKQLGEYYRSLNYYFCAMYSQLGCVHYPVVEAMSCGVPVVTTLYYPASEENSWLTKICDANDIVKQFEMAYSQNAVREQKIEQAFADTRQFEWKKAALQLTSYLEEVKNQQKR